MAVDQDSIDKLNKWTVNEARPIANRSVINLFYCVLVTLSVWLGHLSNIVQNCGAIKKCLELITEKRCLLMAR